MAFVFCVVALRNLSEQLYKHNVYILNFSQILEALQTRLGITIVDCFQTCVNAVNHDPFEILME